MSTVVRVKLTPLSQRIMKSRWQNGQLPTPSPSSLACGGKKRVISLKKKKMAWSENQISYSKSWCFHRFSITIKWLHWVWLVFWGFQSSPELSRSKYCWQIVGFYHRFVRKCGFLTPSLGSKQASNQQVNKPFFFLKDYSYNTIHSHYKPSQCNIVKTYNRFHWKIEKYKLWPWWRAQSLVPPPCLRFCVLNSCGLSAVKPLLANLGETFTSLCPNRLNYPLKSNDRSQTVVLEDRWV